MNKKGMTLVEIIVAISLISVVMIFLFQVLITVINGNKRNNTKSKTLISKAIIMKAVEHDLDTFGLQDNTSVKECGTFDGISDNAKNQIIPIAARSNDYYCIKITYNPLNVKNSEGYLLFYQNNEKGFLAYKRGIYTYDEVGNNVGFIIESQVIREIDAIPKALEEGANNLISFKGDSDLYSLGIEIPIIATDGNNYDLALNYIYNDNVMEPLPEPVEPEEPIVPPTEDNKATITLVLNGGTYDGKTDDVTIETQIGEEVQLSIPTKERYIFNGWEKTRGEGSVVGNKIIANSSTMILKALFVSDTPVSFKTDSWATIASAVKTKKEETSRVYKVGDEKEVLIGGKEYTVRIANNSNYDCTLASKTACGFVVEFVDIIEKTIMNPLSTTDDKVLYQFGTNIGGWPETTMRNFYLKPLLWQLPSDLESAIIDTTVISSHGAKDKSTTRRDGNWESTDKLYLLSTGEIYGNCLSRDCCDTASYPYNGSGSTTTRQLDYYKGVTTSENYERAIKQYNGTNEWWWLRAAYCAEFALSFGYVNINGAIIGWNNSYSPGGVAPAFRIA